MANKPKTIRPPTSARNTGDIGEHLLLYGNG